MSSYVTDVRDAVTTGTGAVRNLGVWPLLLRLAILATGFAAMALALPDAMSPLWRLILAALAAVLPAVLPGSWAVTALELVAVVAWIVRPMASGDVVTWLPLTALAAALYLHHTSSALAAAMPMDTALATEVPIRWLQRAGVVIAATALLGVCGFLLSGHVGVASTVAVPVIGVVAAIVVVGLLLRSLRH